MSFKVFHHGNMLLRVSYSPAAAPLAMASGVPMDAKADTPKAMARGRAITSAEMPRRYPLSDF